MLNTSIIFFQGFIFNVIKNVLFTSMTKFTLKKKLKIKIILKIILKITENWSCSAAFKSACKKWRTPCSNVNIATMLNKDLDRNVTICTQKTPSSFDFLPRLKIVHHFLSLHSESLALYYARKISSDARFLRSDNHETNTGRQNG